MKWTGCWSSERWKIVVSLKKDYTAGVRARLTKNNNLTNYAFFRFLVCVMFITELEQLLI